MTNFIQTPDAPRGFGFKVSWFAVQTSESAVVLDALGFEQATPANWASGLEAVEDHSAWRTGDIWVFISPPVDGWVLAVSAGWPYPMVIEADHDTGRKFDELFRRLMLRFDNVQFFGSHRGTSFVTWAWAASGEPRRIFGFGDGAVLVNFGAQTPEEAQMKLADLSGLAPSEAEDEIYRLCELAETQTADELIAAPGEEDVVNLASLWSIDPTALDVQSHPPGVGLAVRLPKEFTP